MFGSHICLIFYGNINLFFVNRGTQAGKDVVNHHAILNHRRTRGHIQPRQEVNL